MSLHSLITLLVLCLAAPGFGQIRSGSIVGSVVDPAGAAVAGVEVRTTARETNASYHTTTNAAGQYVLPYLQFGEYTVTASKSGFKTAEITGIRVATAEIVRVPVKLEIGAVSSSIEVTAQTAGVEVESGSIQSTTGASAETRVCAPRYSLMRSRSLSSDSALRPRK